MCVCAEYERTLEEQEGDNVPCDFLVIESGVFQKNPTESDNEEITSIFRDESAVDSDSTSNSTGIDTTALLSRRSTFRTRRYDEGHDVPDLKHNSWLKLYHPEASLQASLQHFL